MGLTTHIRLAHRMKQVLVATLAFTLPGCWGVAGLVWNEASVQGKPVAGALNVGNVRPPLQSRCGTTAWMANSPTCAWAFVDSTGHKVDMDVLRAELDSFAEKRPQFHQWINKVGNESVQREMNFPYKLYLLTVSPAVVLAVPRKPKEPHSFCGAPAILGCLQSQSLRGNSYWYRESPVINGDSFWFAPALSNATFPIDSSLQEVRITAGDAVIKLVASGELWQVFREK